MNRRCWVILIKFGMKNLLMLLVAKSNSEFIFCYFRWWNEQFEYNIVLLSYLYGNEQFMLILLIFFFWFNIDCCQHRGAVNIVVLSTSWCCQHRGVANIVVLSTSCFYQHRGVVNIVVLSTSWCCQRRGVVNIVVLSTSWCCQHRGVVNIVV